MRDKVEHYSEMILDCTLRDGGYYTHWEFDDDLVREMVLALDKSEVDYIELGYKSPIPGGRFRKCNDKFISTLLKKELKVINADLAFMIDTKDFLENGGINMKLLRDVIKPKFLSPFTLCRIATNYETLDETLELVDIISDLGYQTTVNLMKVATLTKKAVKESLEKLGKSNVDMIYIADSLGSIHGKQIEELLNLFRKTCIVNDKHLGFHPHNNLGLAFPNTIRAVELGTDIVDGTITGMGRGAGNLRIEQYLMFRQKPTKDLLNLIQKRFVPLMEKSRWGWSPSYMYSGIHEIHPSYPQELQTYNISDVKIQNKLEELSFTGGKEFYNQGEIKSLSKKSVSIIIPARYKSSRFPGKPIVDIDGTPMIIRVADIASKVVPKEKIYIATEDERIAKVVDDYDYKVILTSDSCLTGTDRVCEAAQEINSDIIVNIQGDEPLLDPDDIQKVIDEKLKYPDSVINCMSRFDSTEATNRNIPKVVSNFNNNLVYMSRSAIPGTKSGHSKLVHKQVCIYAFTKKELDTFYQYGLKHGKTPLEWAEDIEILRFVELGINVKMVETFGTTQAVDIPEDVDKVLEILNERKS
jgi:3-deoxy-manno-octulosonate cytidylyltransferase (CMP-KDO synthetase)